MSVISILNISKEELAAFCSRHHIKRLAVFGSFLRGEIKSNSDIDILVEFNDQHIPSLFGVVEMEEELSALLAGRKVDLRTPKDLSHYFRTEVMESAEVLHLEV